MKRPSAKRLAVITLAGILAIGEGGYQIYSRFIRPVEIQPDPVAMQQEIEELREAAKQAEEGYAGYDLYVSDWINSLESENRDLNIKNQQLQECNLNQKLTIAEKKTQRGELELQIYELTHPDEEGKAWTELRTRLEGKLGHFVVDSIERKYPYENIEKLLKKRNVIHDPKIVEDTWKEFSPEKREAFFLAYLDPDAYYQGFSESDKLQYEKFFTGWIKPIDKIKIPDNIGILGDLDKKYSPLSLAVFRIYQHTRDSIQLPPVR